MFLHYSCEQQCNSSHILTDGSKEGILIVVVVWPPSQPRRAGWAAERAPGCFPPGTLCGVRVCVCGRRTRRGYGPGRHSGRVPRRGQGCGRPFVHLLQAGVPRHHVEAPSRAWSILIGCSAVPGDTTHSNKLSPSASNFYAELNGILTGLQTVLTLNAASFSTFTNSKSSILALHHLDSTNPLILQIHSANLSI